MDDLRFAWDSSKAKSNIRKHGVSFPEASSVFYDEWAIEFDDPDHSDQEERFLLLGTSARLRVLVVCHCLGNRTPLSRLSRLGKLTPARSKCIGSVENERQLRFFENEGAQKPLC